MWPVTEPYVALTGKVWPVTEPYVALTDIMRKHLLKLSLAKSKWNAQAVLNTYKLFIYRDIHYITLLIIFCKTVRQNSDTLHQVVIFF